MSDLSGPAFGWTRRLVVAECYSVTPSCSQLYRALTLPQRKTLHRLFPAELFFQGIKDHFMKYKVLHTHAMVQHECFQKNLGRSRKNMIKPALTPPTDKVAAYHQTDTSKTKAIVNFDVSDKDILLDVGRPIKGLLSICLWVGGDWWHALNFQHSILLLINTTTYHMVLFRLCQNSQQTRSS